MPTSGVNSEFRDVSLLPWGHVAYSEMLAKSLGDRSQTEQRWKES